MYNIVVDTHATRNVRIEHILDTGNRIYLCEKIIETELTDENRYLAILSVAFGSQQNNIVFGSEPGKCEKISSFIMQLIEKREDDELLAFSEFLKEHIHKDFLLAETIKYGVAYHYGALPSFIRKEIERLTVEGKISYIVCILRSVTDVDAFQSGRFAKQNGRPKTHKIFSYSCGLITTV